MAFAPGLADHDRLADEPPFGLLHEYAVVDPKADEEQHRERQHERVQRQQELAYGGKRSQARSR